jgi:hypothetical protein
VNEEVVDLVHEVIDVTIIVVPDPREMVVHGFFQLLSTYDADGSKARSRLYL